jgi:hypothetical protein
MMSSPLPSPFRRMYTQVRPSGEFLTNNVALLWVEVGQACFSGSAVEKSKKFTRPIDVTKGREMYETNGSSRTHTHTHTHTSAYSNLLGTRAVILQNGFEY